MRRSPTFRLRWVPAFLRIFVSARLLLLVHVEHSCVLSAIDYGDTGTCDAGAVQKVSDVAPLVYVTVSPNMRLRSKTNPHESPAKFRRIVDYVD